MKTNGFFLDYGRKTFQRADWRVCARFYNDFPAMAFSSTFSRLLINFQKKVTAIRQEFENKLIVDADGFWQEHYRFESTRNPLPAQKTRLIGRERARAIILNIILPAFLVCALEQNDGRLETTVKEVFYQFPAAPQNRVTREMTNRLFPDQIKPGRFINSAQKQQGLIHLFKKLLPTAEMC